MKLGKRDLFIIEEMSKDPDKVWDIQSIGEFLYRGKTRPTYWQNSVSVTMRVLALKTRFAKVRITRSSGLGRGNKASYRIEIS